MKTGGSGNLKNSIWNLVNVALYPVIFLALTPFFIDRLGDALFGTWMILNSVVFISVQLIHFGIGPSLTIYIAELRGKKNDNLINRFFNSGLNFTAALALGIVPISILTYLLIPESWFDWEGIADSSALKIAFSLNLLLISGRLFEQLFIGFFKGFEKFDTLTQFAFTHKLITLIVHAALVYNGYGIAAIITVSIISSALLAFLQYLSCKSFLVEYQYKAIFDGMIFRRLGIYGFWSWLQTLIAILSFQLDRIMVAAFLGMGTVAYYTIASMIANHLHMALEALAAWVFPAVSRIKNENRDSKPLFFTVQNLLLIISGIGLTVLFLVRKPLFMLWLGEVKAAAVLPYLELFIFFEIFYVLSITPKFYLNGLAKLKLITFIELGYKSFSIVLMLVLFYFYRSAEMLINGQIIALMISMPIVLYIIHNKLFRPESLISSLIVVVPMFLLYFSLNIESDIVQLAFLAITAISCYFLLFRHSKFNLKLITE